MKKIGLLWILALGVLWLVPNVNPAWAAYSSHQNDQDINNFLTVYPFAKSTKLDDCSLCHPGSPNGKTGSCDYCHQTYGLQPPHGNVPLNPYGQAYKDAERNQNALRTIESADSDGDGYSNIAEIQALFFPGNNKDYPGLTPAPVVTMSFERILSLPYHSEFLLLNAKKDTDWYARYGGVKMIDLLRYVGARGDATQITVFAPDGFSQTFPIKSSGTQYNVKGPYPQGTYYGGLDFVNYSFIPNKLVDGDQIPDELYMLLGYLRNGAPLAKGKINPATLKLDGEGPYRLIPPQKIAGSPDRPSTASPVGDGWDYDASKDHNAGFSARCVTAIRIEPLPAGTTDFAWTEGGWNLVDQSRVVIYGGIDPQTYPVTGQVLDESGHPVADVQISFGLVSLGKVGEAKSRSDGTFRENLPVGEYIIIPSKAGYVFDPESISMELPRSYKASFPESIQISSRSYKASFTAYPAP